MTTRRQGSRVGFALTVAGLALVLAWPATANQRQARRKTLAQLFTPSGQCVACHNGLVTASGKDVSIAADWRASMMANSARDPYWQAAVRRETLDHPTASAAIQDECSKCHMPMARYTAHLGGGRGEIFAHLPVASARTPQAKLAADGVSCSLCHQITEERFGTRESFVGGFVVDTSRRRGQRRVYGPFAVDGGRQRVMRSSSGFEPRQSEHVRRSELCATCHTLITHTLGKDGSVVGELPEQVPYEEWRHSAYANEQSCQDCHLLPERDPAPISSVLPLPRDGMRPHVFRGGNFVVLGMLGRHRQELGVLASPAELSTTARRTRENLESRAARLAVHGSAVADGRIAVDVEVHNLTGHKLPTAYPSRRAWLHVVVRSATGAVRFESGALASDGSIQGNDNDLDPTRFEPHHTTIDDPSRVQIYEAILGDPGGDVTTGLLTASQYLKDNRVLPRGFDKRTAEPDVAVHGAAQDDPTFLGGADTTRYLVSAGEATPPFTVDVELWYQPIGFRWAENLKRFDAMEPRRFAGYYAEAAAASAVRLAAEQVVIR
jgi:hypothetical protein